MKFLFAEKANKWITCLYSFLQVSSSVMTVSSILVAMAFFLKVSWSYIHNSWSSNYLNLMRSLSSYWDWLSFIVTPQFFSTQPRSPPLKIGIHSLQYCLWLDLWYSSCLTFYCSYPTIPSAFILCYIIAFWHIWDPFLINLSGLGDGIWCRTGIHTLDHNVWGIRKLIYSSKVQEKYIFLNIIKDRT